jgi:hypothetical protein
MVYIYGQNINASDFNKITARGQQQTNQAGAPLSRVYDDIILKLKEKHKEVWTTVHEGNWLIWAAWIVTTTKDEEKQLDEIDKNPPPHLISLFRNLMTTSDVVLTNFTRGAESFSHLLDKLREFEITWHNEVLTILTQYQQLFTTFGEVTSLTPEEHEHALPLISAVQNIEDRDHIEPPT